MRHISKFICALTFSFWGVAPCTASDVVAQFYAGKQIKLIIGASAGGGYDVYGRLLARYWGKHIPGSPGIVPSNMPGAGSNVAAQYIYAVAPKDGTYVGALYASALTEPLLGDASRLKHDPKKLIYVGNANREVFFCAVRSDVEVTSFEESLSKEIVLGATADGGPTRDYPTLEKNILGAKFRLVTGYPGAKEVYLALEKGEVQGACGLTWSNFSRQYGSWLQSGLVRLFVQEDSEGHPDLNRLKVPRAVDFAKTPSDRRVLDLVYAQSVFGRPYVLPPDVPEDRVTALREAFLATLTDRDLLADAGRLGLDITASSGQELQSLITRMYSEPEAIVESAKRALERGR
jgi:tripartite-type tricarboxylate transporter receptor subunit TctC